MNKDILIQLFKAPYKRQAFIDNCLLPTFQGKVSNLKILDEQNVRRIDLTPSEKEYVVSAVQYGEFQTKDEISRTVELYEIIVNDSKQIERSRVGLGALVKKHIIGNNAVLVNFAYENPEKRTWRFSFIARDGVFQDGEMQIKDTHPKRYTYVFGEPEETYKTAIDRFFILVNELEITINKIKDAFGVEAMSNQFFEDYKYVHYAGFVEFITGERLIKRSNSDEWQITNKPHQQFFNCFKLNQTEEKGKKDVRDFVKKLLGRIVFLYFLQKKGWLGAKDTSYKNGDKNFMSNFFKKAGANDAFYADWLSTLFFDALNNNERHNDDFNMPDGEVVKIPYLNGGLFEKESEKYDFLTFPADLFANLFEFFDQYNFTVFEDSPGEHTVAVDPEMLGHIFENLLEDNKDKGAFYTPKEIVHYMTQESLIEYLHTQLPDADRTELENFVKNKENQLSKEHKKQIDQKLDTIKICDPAIGSGAFPMGLLQEIFSLKERIAYELGYKVWSPATVKESIIQKSIYGVDIERGAVDIARLRFWLSLIVDEEMPKALPNLDYKIVVGNSLVSKFDEVVIEIDWEKKKFTSKDENFVKGIQDGLKIVSEKQKHFFESKNNKQKAKLKSEIRDLKLEILINQLSFNKASYLNKNQKIIDMGFGLKPSDHKKNVEIDLQVAEFDNTLAKLNRLKDNPNKPFNHFDWKLDFPEVLNPMVNENTGFDIVIGNPPYIKVQNISKEDALFYKNKYNSANGKYDIYLLFIEHSFMLTKKSGNIIFINPHRFLIADYGKEIRSLIKKDKWLKSILYFGVDQIFNNATTYSGVFHFKENSDFLHFYEPQNKDLNNIIFSKIPYSLLGDTWLITTDNNVIKVLNKIKTYPNILNYCDGVYQGVISVGDKIFMFDGKEKGKYIEGLSEETNQTINIEYEALKPVLKGEDIKRYKPLSRKKYVIYLHKLSEKGKTIPYSENEVKSSFPFAYNYLEQFRNDLIKKKISYKTNSDYWYSLHRSREMNVLCKKGKIITPQLQNKPNFTIDITGEFFPDAGGYIVAPKLEFEYLSKSLLGILNSKLFYYFIVNTSTPYSNNYYYFKTNYIEPFCIPAKITEINNLFANVVQSVLVCNREVIIINNIPNSHISEAFEEVIDALVFELYFPEEFAEKGIEIEKHAQDIFKPIDNLSEEEQIKAIQEAYQTLREKDNPLRNQIKLMKIELKELLLPILSV